MDELRQQMIADMKIEFEKVIEKKLNEYINKLEIIINNLNFGACVECGKPFLIMRKGKKYCTARCGNRVDVRASRKRKELNETKTK